MRKIIVCLFILSIALPVFAGDYWMYIFKLDNITDKTALSSQIVGRASQYDIIDFVPISMRPNGMSTKEKESYVVLRVSGLTMEKMRELKQAEVKSDVVQKCRQYKVDYTTILKKEKYTLAEILPHVIDKTADSVISIDSK